MDKDMRSEQNQRMLRYSYHFEPTSFNPYLDQIKPSDEYRVLILPFDYDVETATRTILSEYRIAAIAPGIISTEEGAYVYWDLISSNIIEEDSTSFLRFLKYGGIKYIIIDKRHTGVAGEWGSIDPQTREINILSEEQRKGKIDNYIYLTPKKLIDFINGTKKLLQTYEDENLVIYENVQYEGLIFPCFLVYGQEDGSLEKILQKNVAYSLQDPDNLPYDAFTSSSIGFLNESKFDKVIYNGTQTYPLEKISTELKLASINEKLGIDFFSIDFHLYNQGKGGWKSVELSIPANVKKHPNSNVDVYDIFYQDSFGKWKSAWEVDGFHDLQDLNGIKIPVVLYTSEQEGGKRYLESFSMGSLSLEPESTIYSSITHKGHNKRLSFYMQPNQSINLKLILYLNTTKPPLSFSQNYKISVMKKGAYDVIYTPTPMSEADNLTLLSENIPYKMMMENGYVFYTNVTINKNDTILTLVCDSLIDYQKSELFVLPKGLKENILNNYTSITSIEEINPTRYFVEVNSSEPFFLAFTCSHNTNWVARVDEDNIKAFPLSAGVNSFYINKTGNFKVIIEYTPQLEYEKVLRTSFYIIAVTTIFLLFQNKLLKKLNQYVNQLSG
jgi:hypothetical protein